MIKLKESTGYHYLRYLIIPLTSSFSMLLFQEYLGRDSFMSWI